MSHKSELIRQIAGAMESELMPLPGETMTVAEIDSRLDELDRKFQNLLIKATEEGAEGYTDNFRAIMEESAALKKRKLAIEEQRKENADANQHIARAVEKLESASSALTVWDEATIRQLVDTVKVVSADEIIVYLRGGVEIQQHIIK